MLRDCWSGFAVLLSAQGDRGGRFFGALQRFAFNPRFNFGRGQDSMRRAGGANARGRYNRRSLKPISFYFPSIRYI